MIWTLRRGLNRRISTFLGMREALLSKARCAIWANPLPLPDRVVPGTAQLKPRLIRVFIQEFFQVYPEHGRFDWSRLDPYSGP
jgi:hypothetical protein